MEFPLVIIATFVFLFSIYTFSISHRRRRKKLLNAVYHHVKEFQKGPEYFDEEQRDKIKEKIKKDKNFMPYTVLSSANNLSYEHIIEAMEWLKSEKTGDDESEEGLLSKYFHSHAFFCAHAESFEKNLVLTWPTDRKLAIWDGFADAQKETSDYAGKLEPVLEKAINEQKKGPIGRFLSNIIKAIGRL